MTVAGIIARVQGAMNQQKNSVILKEMKTMTIEQLVPIIVRYLKESGWPGHDGNFFDCDWPGLAHGTWYHPRWLAQMVVGIVEERLSKYGDRRIGLKLTLRDFSLTKADYEWLKGKVGD